LIFSKCSVSPTDFAEEAFLILDRGHREFETSLSFIQLAVLPAKVKAGIESKKERNSGKG
jgi:hypothetical protein